MSTQTEEKVRTILSGWIAPVLTGVITIMLGVIGFLAKTELQNIHAGQDSLLQEVRDVKKCQQKQEVDFTKYDGRLTKIESDQKDFKTKQERTTDDLVDLKIDLAMKKGIRL